KLLADLAVVAGQIGKPRSGIIQLKPKANSQGLSDLGAGNGPAAVVAGIADGSVKGLFILGENPVEAKLDGLQLLVVQDTHLTETALKADVVLPGAGFAESCGTFTSAERRIQILNQAIPTLAGVDNADAIMMVVEAFSKTEEYCCAECLFEEIEAAVPEYKGVELGNPANSFWPAKDSRVLYARAYNFADGKAQLQVVGAAPLFRDASDSDNLENTFNAFLKEKQLV
ncbi:MAG: molybdopterin-dependent oxidoreductase, partial [Clostridiales bacterium]|nr:molybdopterin-dependent oxidoreductase [Clostridiales bacterium]